MGAWGYESENNDMTRDLWNKITDEFHRKNNYVYNTIETYIKDLNNDDGEMKYIIKRYRKEFKHNDAFSNVIKFLKGEKKNTKLWYEILSKSTSNSNPRILQAFITKYLTDNVVIKNGKTKQKEESNTKIIGIINLFHKTFPNYEMSKKLKQLGYIACIELVDLYSSENPSKFDNIKFRINQVKKESVLFKDYL